MAYNDDQNEFPLPAGKNPKRSSVEQLPRFFRTPQNKKFLSSTLDQLTNPGVIEKINGFVGKREAKAATIEDNYVEDISKSRNDYQFEPVSVYEDFLGSTKYYSDYNDYIGLLKTYNANTDNHSALNEQEYYAWNPNINLDKFANFREYYWLPNGPQEVAIKGQSKEVISTYRLEVLEQDNDISLLFHPDGLTKNPTLNLYRGQTYRFEINAPGNPLSIALYRGVDPNELLDDSSILNQTYTEGVTLIPDTDDILLNQDDFVAEDYIEKGILEFTIPDNAPDTLYFISQYDLNISSRLQISNIDAASKIDVENEILDKKTYTTSDGWALSNGMKVYFIGDVTPAKYAEGIWYVEGVGDEIRLIAAEDLQVPAIFTNDSIVPFDKNGFDRVPYGNAKSFAGTKDYIVVNKSSPDRNPWARYNRWFHKDVVTKSAELNGQSFDLPEENRAKRPIIEFDTGLKLFNFGAKAKDNIDLIDTYTNDVKSKIEGQPGYSVDGVELSNGMRVMFVNDTDSFVYGKVFEVKFFDFKGNRQISLVETTDTMPAENETVLVKDGNANAGAMYWYDGTTWKKAQEKTGVNQAPLFDLCDAEGNSFSDTITYPASDFKGCRIFNYAVGEGSNDAEIGFPLTYKNINNTGDIVFDFSLLKDKFTYEVSNQVFTVDTSTGFLKKYGHIGDTLEYVNGWVKAPTMSKQYIVRKFTGQERTNNFVIDVYKESGYINDLKVIVYVNNEVKTEGVDFNFAIDSNYDKRVQFFKDLDVNDILIIKAHSKTATKTSVGYYETPHNFERNPLNEDITQFTLGEVSDHVDSVAEEVPNFVGKQPGANNLRDLGNVKKYGRKFVQHSGPINLPLFSISNKENNLIAAINFAKNEYSKFKRAFVQEAENLDLSGSIKEQVDTVLLSLVKDKKSSMPFYQTDMLGIGANKKITHTVLDTDIKFYALSAPFTLTVLSEKAVNVYVNGTQVCHNLDYTFTTEGFVQFDTDFNLAVDDVIEIYEYETTNGSYIPQTPTKLGLFPAYKPEVFVDTTYQENQTVIRGHDGSIIIGYQDYRDDLLLEFEKRVYNNLKVPYDSSIFDVYDYISGEYRNSKVSTKDLNRILISDFVNWLTKAGNADYTENTFVQEAATFTYNYGFGSSKNNKPLAGFWRGIYVNAYDTDSPNLRPWEMLGFAVQPTWWESKYGPAPYTSDNKVLWEDLEKGIIRSSDLIRTDKRFIRPGLTKHIPVDQSGNILSPLDSGYVNEFSFGVQNGQPFKFGDHTPAETAWRRSSEYPFALLKAIMINRPAQILGVGFDRSRMSRNLVGQLVYNGVTSERIKLSNLLFTNTIVNEQNILTAGFNNYIYDYMSSDITTQYSNFTTKLRNLKQKIAFKLGGFADKEKLKLVLDSKNPSNKGNVFVPFENYKIDLIQSSPLTTVTYSGVIIEKRSNGFKISGYDKENPVFTYSTPVLSSNDISINVGGISESFLNWTEDKQYIAGKIVRYENTFYRVNVSHTTTEVFDNSFYTPLRDLPIIGGASATLRKNFSNITATLDYGTVLSTAQEVVDFIQGYEDYLKKQGFVFDYFNKETEAVENWTLSIKEFLFYTTQNWAVGTIITLSPSANSLNFSKDYFVIDNVQENIFNYKILNLDGTAVKDISISISRDAGNSVEILPASGDSAIYFAKLGLIQKDHSVVIDNSTVFNDTIYNPSSGYRQERIKVVGYRTDNWNGNLDIPGFIYDQANITEWEQWQDYALGDLVKYKEFYYSANTFISGQSVFDSSQWNRLDGKPQSGLKTNFDYKVNQFADFYDLDTDNFDSEQQRLAQHLIGYQKREYLDNIIEDDISQYKFYQGFIQEKGTLNSLTKFFDKLGSADQESLEFYEEWAIRNAQYGATDTFDELEYKLDETKFRIEPQIIELVDAVNNNRTDLVYEIPESKVYIKPQGYTKTPFPKKYSTEEFAKTAGYVSLDQVDFLAKTPDDILELDISNVAVDDIIWVTSERNSWNIYQHITIPNRVETYTKTSTGFDLRFDSIPDLQVGEIFGVQFVNDLVDGFYKISSISSTLVSVVADITYPEESLDLRDSTAGIVTKLLSKRYDTPTSVNADINKFGLNENNTIWIDNVANDKFGVFKNNKIFNKKQELFNVESGDGGFASSFAVNDVNSIFAVGRPDDEKVFIYTRSSESQDLNFIQEIEMTPGFHDNASGFGQKIKFSNDGQFMFVAAPLANNVKTRYRGEAESTFNIVKDDIVSDRGTLWRAKRATDDDSSSINTNSRDWEQVYKIPADDEGYVSGLNNQGCVYVYKKQLDNTYFLLEQFVSNEPTADEKFGIGLESAFTTDETYKLYVRSEGNNGRVYMFDTTFAQMEFRGTIDPTFRGDWDNFHSYVTGAIVQEEGQLYKAKVDIPKGGNGPTDIALWESIDVNIDRFGYLPYASTIQGDTDSTAFNNTTSAGKNIGVSTNGEVLSFTAFNNSTNEFQVNVYRLQEGRYAFYEAITSPSTNVSWGASVALSDDGSYIAVGANLEDIVTTDDLGIDKGIVYIYKYNTSTQQFENTQTLQAPAATKNERFGYKVEFSNNKLCVIGVNGLNIGSTLFDTNETTFDNNSTKLYDFSTRRPQAYTYELLNDIYTVSEVIDYESYYVDNGLTLQRDLASANDVEVVYQNNHLYLGFDGLDTGDSKFGLIFDLRHDRDVTNWNTLGAATDFIDYEKMRGAFLYDSVTSDLITYIDIIDPIQGKIANAAEREINYKLYYDPAVYNIGNTDTGIVNPWGEERVGELLWDLNAVKWYNPYQKNSDYSSNTWNKIIPGYTIDIYEWVSSTLLPDEWDAVADTTEGLADGISGSTRYGNTRYVRKNVYDPVSGLFSAKYYYWVKNTKVLPAVENRNITAAAVASLIEDPAGNGYRFLAMFGADNFAVYNCTNLIKDTDTVLHFEYYNTDEVKINNLHREYNLLTEGLSTSQPNDRLVGKWIDSLVGYDEQRTLLPVTTLSVARRYGILDDPLQTMFVNKTEALKQVIERINLVLRKKLIVDEFDISGLSAKDPQPTTVSREFDTTVDDQTLLRFIGTSKIQQATLSVDIVDGRLTNITITNPGRGYIDPAYNSSTDTKRRGPKVTITGSGMGAEIETYINNLGQVIEANIVNEGKNYNPATTTVTVRPFTALIKTDTTLLGFWATYIWNATEKEWVRINNQNYDASLYWKYIDWYAEGFSKETSIDYLVPGSYALGGLEDNLGDIVKIESIGSGGWLLLRKIDNQLEVDYTVNYETIGRQNGTIEFSSLLYNNDRFGFDKAVYDSALYDRDAGEEVRIILQTINKSIFVDELKVEWNKLFFSSVRYALAEQPNIDWIFKTAFVKAKHNVGSLEQKTTYKSDSLESYNQYVAEVKPYSTKIREFLSAYENIDPTATNVTDFDLPPRYDLNAQKIVSETANVVDSKIRNYSEFVTTYPQRNWFDNVGFEVKEVVLTDGGSGWTNAPRVVMSGGGGPTVIGSTTINEGRVTGIVIDFANLKYITAPNITFEGDQGNVSTSTVQFNVTVASGTNTYGAGNKYYIQGYADVSPILTLLEGQTYRFDQSDPSNATHQLLISTTANGTWDGGVEYTTGVTKVGTAGSPGAYTEITVPTGAPTLYYYCINHSGMGGQANTTAGTQQNYSTTIKPARATAIIGNGPVRATHMLIKFDRVAGAYVVTDLDVTQNFTGTGSQVDYILKWPINVKPANTKITVNGVEQLSNDYTVTNVKDTTASYPRYYGKITFTNAPAINDAIVIEYDKDIDYLTASDRINFFYNPTSGQFGKDLGQLMDGVDYGGVQIDTASFGASQGFNNGDFFGSTPFDRFSTNNEDEVFILDGSTQSITVSKPFEAGIKYNVYFKASTAGVDVDPTRIDSEDFGTAEAPETATMLTIVGDGITSTFIIDEDLLVTRDGDTIIVRKETSDGAVTPSGVIFDTQISGGDLTNVAGQFSTATGIDAANIVIDGDDFVSPTTSKGTEENVPGQILDTLDLQVFERVSDGQGAITVQNFQTDGVSAEYYIESLPSNEDSVIVKLDNVVLDTSQYEIDYAENVLRISDSSLLPVGKHLSLLTIGTNGSNIIESDTFTGDGRTNNFVTYYKFEQNVTAVVSVNGVISTTFGLDASGPEYGDNANKIMIVFGETPPANSIITYTLYKGSGKQYSQLAIDDTFNRTVTTNRSHTFGVNGAVPLPFNKKPFSHNILVKVGDDFLDAGYVKKHTLTTARTYEIDNWQFIDQTLIKQSDVLIYINDQIVDPVNYVFSTIDGRIELTTREVGKSGDIMRVYLLNDSQYFFVDTVVKLTNAATLFEYAPLEKINFELNDSTSVIATVQEYTKSGSEVTIKLQGYVRDLVLLADKDDTPSLWADDSTQFKIDSINIVESDRLSLKDIPNDDVKIYVFSNHDTNEFERLSLRVAYEDENAPAGSDNYLSRNLLSKGEIKLDKKIPGPEYAWVFLNGKFLTSQADYTLSDNREYIILSEQPIKDDRIEILYFTADVSKKKFAYRIFKDVLNRYHYKRINSAMEYELATDLNWYDLSINLKSSDGLDEPNRELAIPGIIFINGERIEYFVKQGNILRQLRRGTLGTGVKDVHPRHSRVFHQGVSETIPYQDTTYTQTFTGDGSSTTFNLNWTPNSVNEFDVFVAGTRLRKATPIVNANDGIDYNYYEYDSTLDQDSPGGDVVVPAEFTVENNILTLVTAPLADTEVRIIRKTGKIWNDDGVSLASSKNTISRFLTDSTYKLAR